MKATTRLTISLILAGGCHAALFILPSLFSKENAAASNQEIEDSSQTPMPQSVQLRPKPEEQQEEIAARVTNTQKDLEMNGGKKEIKDIKKPQPEIVNEPAKDLAKNEEKVEEKKEEYTESKEQTLQKEIVKASENKKEVIESQLTTEDYTQYIKSLDVGRAKGLPTPTLITAHYDIAEIQAVHGYFGLQIIGVNTQKMQDVVKINFSSANSGRLTVTRGFNWKGYSNRIFPRTEPYFKQYSQQAASLLGADNARILTIVPAGADSYFRYKTLTVLKNASLDKDTVSAVISRFHKTAFGAWVLIIEKAQMHDGSFVNLNDFELTKLKQG